MVEKNGFPEEEYIGFVCVDAENSHWVDKGEVDFVEKGEDAIGYLGKRVDEGLIDELEVVEIEKIDVVVVGCKS